MVSQAWKGLHKKWKRIKNDIIERKEDNLMNVILESLEGERAPKEAIVKFNELKQLIAETESQLPDTGSKEAAIPVSDRKPETTGETAKIEQFFETVGKGVIAAQKNLDRDSTKYVLGRPELVHPTLFRIPKVNAEIHFAIEDMTKEGFNVFVYGASETRRIEQQHKVSFDIVAAPPPPGLDQRLQRISIADLLVADPSHRDQAMNILTNFIKQNEKSDKESTKALVKKSRIFLKQINRIIIIRRENSWALVYPLKTPGEPVNLDVIDLFKTEDGFELRYGGKPHIDPPPAIAARFKNLAAIIDELADQQVKILEELEKKA